jgi:hypothetical protein
MPIHNRTRVPAGTYHFVHQRWISAIADTLNAGGFPEGYFAMSEVDAKGRGENTAGYARRADRLSVYLPRGELIAVVEIVSPGNKDNANGLKQFARKAGRLLRRGVHLLVVDLFRRRFATHTASTSRSGRSSRTSRSNCRRSSR